MSNEVEVPKALKKFLILVTLSGVFGFFLNAFIQQSAQEQWDPVSRRLKEKGIQTTAPRILFSKSGWPVIGASLPSLIYESSAKCFKYQIKAEELFVPLSLTQLFFMRLKLGTLEVQKVQVEFHEDEFCSLPEAPVSSEVDSSQEVFEEVETLQQQVKKIVKEPLLFQISDQWFAFLDSPQKESPLHQIRLKNLIITGSSLKNKHLKAEGEGFVSLRGDLQAQFKLQKLTLGKTDRSVTTHFIADLFADRDQVSLRGDWGYHEGHLTADINYKRNQQVLILLASRDVPLSLINRWFDTLWTFQFVWFNCGLQLETSRAAWNETPWNIQKCAVTGPYGDLRIETQKTKSLQELQAVSLKASDLQLDKIFKGKEFLPLTGVLKEFGILNGQFAFEKEEWSGKLKLSNSQIVFSRKNKRLLQILDESQWEVFYKNGVATVLLSSAKIRDGAYAGLIAIDYNKKIKAANAKVALDKIAFSPAIQNLMIEGKITPLAIHGEFHLDSHFAIENAKANLEFKGYEGGGLDIESASVLLGWNNYQSQIALAAKKMQVLRQSNFPWIFASVLDYGVNKNTLDFQQLYLKGRLDKANLQIEKATGTVADGRFDLHGKSSLQEGQGRVSWAFPAKKNYEWEWSYRSQDLTWIPQNKNMRDWLQENSAFLSEYPFIR